MKKTDYNTTAKKTKDEVIKWANSEITKTTSPTTINLYKVLVSTISIGYIEDDNNVSYLVKFLLSSFDNTIDKIKSNDKKSLNEGDKSLEEHLEFIRSALILLPLRLTLDVFEYEHNKKSTREVIKWIEGHCFDPNDIESKEAIEVIFETIKKLEAIVKKEEDSLNSKYNKHFSRDFLTEEDEEKIISDIIKIVAFEKGYKLHSVNNDGYNGVDIIINNDKSKIRISISNFMNGINYDYHEQFDYFEATLEKLINVANNVNEVEYSKFNIESKCKK